MGFKEIIMPRLGIIPRNHDYHTQPGQYTGADMPNQNQVCNKLGNSHLLKKKKDFKPRICFYTFMPCS